MLINLIIFLSSEKVKKSIIKHHSINQIDYSEQYLECMS